MVHFKAAKCCQSAHHLYLASLCFIQKQDINDQFTEISHSSSRQQLLCPTEIKIQWAWELLPLTNNCQNTIAWAKSAVAYHSDLYHMLCWCSTSKLHHFFYLHKEYSYSFERRIAKRPCNKVIYCKRLLPWNFLGRRNNTNIQEKKYAHNKHQFRCAEYGKCNVSFYKMGYSNKTVYCFCK